MAKSVVIPAVTRKLYLLTHVQRQPIAAHDEQGKEDKDGDGSDEAQAPLRIPQGRLSRCAPRGRMSEVFLPAPAPGGDRKARRSRWHRGTARSDSRCRWCSQRVARSYAARSIWEKGHDDAQRSPRRYQRAHEPTKRLLRPRNSVTAPMAIDEIMAAEKCGSR